MERFVDIIDTPLGRLRGRDCIFLDKAALKGNKLILEGEINGALANKTAQKEWISYRLTFNGVIAHFSCELDTYENISEENNFKLGGCFGVIEESGQLKKLPVRSDFDKSEYKHFRVCTYDYVFDIFARSFELDTDIINTRGD